MCATPVDKLMAQAFLLKTQIMRPKAEAGELGVPRIAWP